MCVSVTALAATYLVYKSQVRCYKVLGGVSNQCVVWILLKTLCSPVLPSFVVCSMLYVLCNVRTVVYVIHFMFVPGCTM